MSITLDEFQSLLLAPWLPISPSILSTTTLPKHPHRHPALSPHAPQSLNHRAVTLDSTPNVDYFAFLQDPSSWSHTANIPHFHQLSDVLSDFNEYSGLTQTYFLAKCIELYEPSTSSSSSTPQLLDPFLEDFLPDTQHTQQHNPSKPVLTGLQKKNFDSLPVPLHSHKIPDNFIGYLLLLTDTQNVWTCRLLSPESQQFRQATSTPATTLETGISDLFLQRNWPSPAYKQQGSNDSGNSANNSSNNSSDPFARDSLQSQNLTAATASRSKMNKMNTMLVKSEHSVHNSLAPLPTPNFAGDDFASEQTQMGDGNSGMNPLGQGNSTDLTQSPTLTTYYTNTDSFFFPYPKSLFPLFDPLLHHDLAKFNTPVAKPSLLAQPPANPLLSSINPMLASTALPTNLSWSVGSIPFNLLPQQTQQYYKAHPLNRTHTLSPSTPSHLPLIFQCQFTMGNLPRHWTFVATPLLPSQITLPPLLPPTPLSHPAHAPQSKFSGFKKQSQQNTELQHKMKVLDLLIPSQHLPTSQRLALFSSLTYSTATDVSDPNHPSFDEFSSNHPSDGTAHNLNNPNAVIIPKMSVDENLDRLGEDIVFEINEAFLLSQLLALPTLSQLNLLHATTSRDLRQAFTLLASSSSTTGSSSTSSWHAFQQTTPLHQMGHDGSDFGFNPLSNQVHQQSANDPSLANPGSSLLFVPQASQLQMGAGSLMNAGPFGPGSTMNTIISNAPNINPLDPTNPTQLPSVFPNRFLHDKLPIPPTRLMVTTTANEPSSLHHDSNPSTSLNLPLKRTPLTLSLAPTALNPLFSTTPQQALILSPPTALSNATTALSHFPSLDPLLPVPHPTPAHFLHSTLTAHLYPTLTASTASTTAYYLDLHKLYQRQAEQDKLERTRKAEEERQAKERQRQAEETLNQQKLLAAQRTQAEQEHRAKLRAAKGTHLKMQDDDDDLDFTHFGDDNNFADPFDGVFDDFTADDDTQKRNKTRGAPVSKAAEKAAPKAATKAGAKTKKVVASSDDDFGLGDDDEFDDFQPRKPKRGTATAAATTTTAAAKGKAAETKPAATAAKYQLDSDSESDDYGFHNVQAAKLAGAKKKPALSTTALARSGSVSDSSSLPARKALAPPPPPSAPRAAVAAPPPPPPSARSVAAARPPPPPMPGRGLPGRRGAKGDSDGEDGLSNRRKKF